MWQFAGEMLEHDGRFLVVGIGRHRFALPMGRVAGVAVLDPGTAHAAEREGAFEWQGDRWPVWSPPGIDSQPAAGASMVLLDAPRLAMVCDAWSSIRQPAALLRVPDALARIHPCVREAFLHEGDLVFCLRPQAMRA